MNKENEIEGMVNIIQSVNKETIDTIMWLINGTSYCGKLWGLAQDSAKSLVNAGYGNVKQAVKEFAEEFHNRCDEQLHPLEWEYGEGALDVLRIFNELYKELYGEK